jgi:protein-arginine kinase activator protein McsA
MLKRHYLHCPGNYCNVFLEEGVSAVAKSATVLNKSILLDKYENSPSTEDDPLGLNYRSYLSLDFLMQKLPSMRPSNFYNMVKVCKNCQLSYSIIDYQRVKNFAKNQTAQCTKETDTSISAMQTKLSNSTLHFVSSIEKYKKRMQDKKKQELSNMKSILVPIDQSRMSITAMKLLSQYKNTKGFDSEDEDIVPIIKESKTTTFYDKGEICELAKSVTDKMQLERRRIFRFKPSKTLPFEFDKK